MGLSQILSLRHEVKTIMKERTPDKVCSAVGSALLGAMFVGAILAAMQPFSWSIWLSIICMGFLGIICILTGFLYKKYGIETRVAEFELKKREVEWEHWMKNPKLKETEIFLDNDLQMIRDEMAVIRQTYEVVMSGLIDKFRNLEKTNGNSKEELDDLDLLDGIIKTSNGKTV